MHNKISLLFIIVFTLSILTLACNQTASTTTAQGLISGPDVGTGGNDGDSIFDSLAVSQTSAEVLYIGSEGNGIFKSIDGGTNWTWLRSGLIYINLGDTSAYAEIYETVINPDNENIIYVATTPGSVGGVYKSIDGGTTWSRITSGLGSTYVDCIALDPNDPSIVYVGTDGNSDVGGIFKSTNSGESFSEITTLPTYTDASRFEKIKLTSSQKIFALGVNYSNSLEAVGLIKSTDGGLSWTNINPSGVYLSFFDTNADASLIYAVGDDNNIVYKSTNEGSSWIEVSIVYIGGTVKISPFDDTTVFYSAGNSMCKSSDGLQTTSTVLTYEASSGSRFDMEFSAADQDTIYVGQGGLAIYKSTDGGDTFAKIADLREFIDAE